ncbi:30S ribosomal protein S16 [bacterium]|jgi:small subunit ribosomal protein S16|nr:30S ribosomal protein S16 [bacterium]MBP5435508.1 30S ribosomal protein S16 [bacterium]MBR6245134.1 30S ribosomal protein S16 [bacterium]
MSVSIRLTRVGSKKKPAYRVVVLDSRKKRDSDYIERIGHYNPCVNPAEIVIDTDKLNEWIKKGAQCSDTVASLVKKAGKAAK